MRKSSNSCFSRSWKRGNLKKYLTRLSSIESQPKKVAVVVMVVVVVVVGCWLLLALLLVLLLLLFFVKETYV